MKGILAIFALVVLVVNVYGFDGGPWDWSRKRGGRPPFDGHCLGRPNYGCRGPKVFFPACKCFFDEIEKILAREGRPNCPKYDCDECLFNYFLDARNKVKVEPSKECIDQILKFLQGKDPDTTALPITTTLLDTTTLPDTTALPDTTETVTDTSTVTVSTVDTSAP